MGKGILLWLLGVPIPATALQGPALEPLEP